MNAGTGHRSTSATRVILPVTVCTQFDRGFQTDPTNFYASTRSPTKSAVTLHHVFGPTRSHLVRATRWSYGSGARPTWPNSGRGSPSLIGISFTERALKHVWSHITHIYILHKYVRRLSRRAFACNSRSSKLVTELYCGRGGAPLGRFGNEKRLSFVAEMAQRERAIGRDSCERCLVRLGSGRTSVTCTLPLAALWKTQTSVCAGVPTQQPQALHRNSRLDVTHSYILHN